MSTSVQDRIRQFNVQGTDVRQKYIFAGHGGWTAAYGYVTIPVNTTFAFYVVDGTSIGSDKSLDVDRGEFDGLGRLKRANGTILPPIDLYRAGDVVKNYVLMPRTKLQDAQTTTVDRTARSIGRADGGAVIGKRSMDMRFGNSKSDNRFITLDEGNSLFLSQILTNEKYINADLHWSACRVVM